MENALGIKVDGPIRALRRLLYCGEWIESHTLHVHLLHAPDFLGYESGIAMASDHREAVERGLRIKKTGNEILTLIGGREIHPINVRVGGFYSVPRKRELAQLAEHLKWARDAATEVVRWVAGFSFPDFTRDYEFVSLRHPEEYPIIDGRLASNKGLDIAICDYEHHFTEEQVPHSTALQSTQNARGAYFVGPLARYNLNFDRLSALAQDAARAAGLEPTCRNPFQSIVARAIEVLYACDEALRIISGYEMPERPFVDVPASAGLGYGCTEAPRGTLYHRYRLSDDGSILDAKIVPPTSQNQKSIEGDLWQLVSANIAMPDKDLQWRCEQAARNYDPCISCSTHFLRFRREREE